MQSRLPRPNHHSIHVLSSAGKPPFDLLFREVATLMSRKFLRGFCGLNTAILCRSPMYRHPAAPVPALMVLSPLDSPTAGNRCSMLVITLKILGGFAAGTERGGGSRRICMEPQ